MALDRRTFLRSLGLSGLSVGLGIPARATQPSPITSGVKDLSSIKATGVVRSNGKGIAGVSVTDGINVVVTDKRGNYSLTTNTTAEFIYISTPKGYAFTNSHGVTKFYERIIVTAGSFRADFELTKLDRDDRLHTFIVWADPQIQTPEDAVLLKTVSAPDTKQLVTTLGPDALVHGFGCGDLVWDRFDLFPDYKEAFGQVGIPFFQVIGNHDMDLDSRTDDYSARTFKDLFGPTYYSFNRGDIHYVVLDDVFFLGTSKKYIGYIAERQFAWLEQDLAQVKPGSTVVVSVHIPVNTGVKRRNPLEGEPIGGVVSNRRELYRILKPYKAHIMSGHTHFNEKVLEGDNVIEHVHGAVCGAWWTGPICYDGTPNGYGVYEVDGSDIKWYHKAVGHDRQHQFRIYPMGSDKQKPEYFSVNVWNWDPAWKVTWFENGEPRGEMYRDVAYDPLSVELHLGIQKPFIRSWVEPMLTDHMFFAKPSSPTSIITIHVTDRFGTVYKEEVELASLTLKV
ncbi:MAG TPA: calcineurin-like phosphoesterase family protein [Ohtaekwangia sp.]|nr:calcineurin-like phosphoesterase family protein [Ohtaekwangia sp.]